MQFSAAYYYLSLRYSYSPITLFPNNLGLCCSLNVKIVTLRKVLY
jgi:hypothetical protein